jgi:hypothetical protein
VRAGGGDGLGGADGADHAAQLREFFLFLVGGVGEDGLFELGELGVELGIVGAEVVEVGQDVLAFVLLVQAGVDHAVAGVVAGGQVHDLFLGALVHGEQPDKVLEGVALLLAGAGLDPGEQGFVSRRVPWTAALSTSARWTARRPVRACDRNSAL